MNAHLPAFRWFHVFRNPSVRTGAYTGVFLILLFSTWLVLANRSPIPMLEQFAMERNIVAGTALCLFAAIPILRFMRWPGHLLASGLIAWIIFTLGYRTLCSIFSGLSSWHSTFQVFMLGAVVYMIFTTLCWLGTILWKVRGSTAPHPHNRAS